MVIPKAKYIFIFCILYNSVVNFDIPNRRRCGFLPFCFRNQSDNGYILAETRSWFPSEINSCVWTDYFSNFNYSLYYCCFHSATATNVKSHNPNLAAHLKHHQEVIPSEWKQFLNRTRLDWGRGQVCDVLCSDYNGLKNWLNINHSNRALGTD
jgi:hypothetical protein